MSIHIAGHQMEVGESLTAFINEELTRLLDKHVGEIYESHLHMSKNHHEFAVDLSVHVSKNLVIHCKGHDADAYRSVTLALEKLEKRVKKYRERLRDRKRNHHHEKADFNASYFVVNHESEDSGADKPAIIAELTHPVHSLSVSEAVMRLDLTDAPVIVFRDAGDNEINVVYRRKDGNVGWINPAKRA